MRLGVCVPKIINRHFLKRAVKVSWNPGMFQREDRLNTPMEDWNMFPQSKLMQELLPHSWHQRNHRTRLLSMMYGLWSINCIFIINCWIFSSFLDFPKRSLKFFLWLLNQGMFIYCTSVFEGLSKTLFLKRILNFWDVNLRIWIVQDILYFY